jgi:methylenetetrahydrofolate dehydrogenase (NADP+)/methenyltetrahydrofolate cyclohydrolase
MIEAASKLMTSKEPVAQIKTNQLQSAEQLKASGITPKLAIVVTVDSPVINAYMKMKQKYGADLGAEVEVHRITVNEAADTLAQLNADEAVHGIIVQLPLADTDRTEEVVNQVAPEKDVDALGSRASFIPATPMAILWLIAGYNVDLHSKKVVLVGRGKLVGAPLERLLQDEGVDVTVATRSTTPDIPAVVRTADVIITATGHHGAVQSDMIKEGAVVVDAGVAGEGGKTVGDLNPDVYEREDLLVTPTKGGVGPLTVCALFENVLTAAGAATQRSATVFYKENV